VVLSGKQKAAMLLMSLDPATAAELLKGVDPEAVQELAVEVAYLDVNGFGNSGQSTEVARQFCHSLSLERTRSLEAAQGFNLQGFLRTMLTSTIGREKAEAIQTQIDDLLQQRDPFIPIRQAASPLLGAILSKEHPQASAVVLAELSPKKSSEVLSLMDEQVRLSVVTRMTAGETMTADAKMRIAQVICGHLEAAQTGEGDAPVAVEVEEKQDPASRKVAVMLRNLEKEIRDGLLASVRKKDAEAGEMITDLMVIWEDIPVVEDRPLQEALREVDSQQLALALVEADEIIVNKIKSNISERVAEGIEEEMSLMSSPKKPEIEEARENVVRVLRQMNEKGELEFIVEE